MRFLLIVAARVELLWQRKAGSKNALRRISFFQKDHVLVLCIRGCCLSLDSSDPHFEYNPLLSLASSSSTWNDSSYCVPIVGNYLWNGMVDSLEG